jgi:pimeloyl-ACP methyl ester carboxylesterase
MPLSAADLHASYRPADAGNGFTGLTPTQPFWVTPAVAAAEATRQEVRLSALPVESVADTESPPAGWEGPHLGLDQAGSVALVRGGPGVAGPQECPTGNPPLPDGTTCFAGQDKNGAYYLIAIPENWSGAVVLYAHGGPSFTPPVPLTADSLVAREALLPQGIAITATSYRSGGYHVSQDAEDVENLRQLFVKVVGPPTRTVVFGISYGGPVAAKVAELYGVNPDGSHNYDGAVIGAGVLAGYRRAFYERLDLRVVYQHYCHNHPYPDELQYPLWQGLSPGTEMTTDELTRRINECTAVQLPPEERTPQQQENLTNILNVIRIPEASLIGNLVTGTITLGDITQHFLNGRNAFPNRDVRYAGSADDRALNRGVTREGYRYYSDRSAVAALDTDSQPTGRVEIPVVTIHAINDPMVFVENEAAYRETLTRAGRLHLLFQTFVNRAGHPGLILAEYGAAFDAVFNWIETGDRPTQERVITSCAQYQKWLGGTCQIDPKYQPAPLESRIYPRRP